MPRDIYFQKPGGPLLNVLGKGLRRGPPMSGAGLYGGAKPAGGPGQYRMSVHSDDVKNLLAGETIASIRWTSGEDAMAIKKIRIGIFSTVGFTTPQTVDIGVYIARDFATPDQGGVALDSTSPHAWELDSYSGPTDIMIGDGRVASLMPVAAGSRALSAHPFMTVAAFPTATAGAGSNVMTDQMFGVFLATNPILLHANEGLVWNLLTTLGAAGRIAVYFELEWDEVPESSH